MVASCQLPSRLQRNLRNRIQVRQQAKKPRLLKRATTPQAYSQRQSEVVADPRRLLSRQMMTARWSAIMTTKIITTTTTTLIRRTTHSHLIMTQFNMSVVPVARLTQQSISSKTQSQKMMNKMMSSHGMNIASSAKMAEM